MSSRRHVYGRHGQGRDSHDQNDTRNEDDSVGHDSSTAMSLDESSIHLNVTTSTPATGGSFSRGGWGSGRRSNVAGFAAASPNFSPVGSESASMSISGMDHTPHTTPSILLSAAKGQRINTRVSSGKFDQTSYKTSEPVSTGKNDGKGGPTSSNGNNVDSNDDILSTGKRNTGGQRNVAHSDTGVVGTTRFRHWDSSWDLEEARSQLRRASRECSRRGLKLASRWASEQLMGLALLQPGTNGEPPTYSNDDFEFLEECSKPNDVELYAMSLFDLGEYSRAAYTLSSPSSHNFSSSSDGSFGQIHPPRNDLTPLGIYLRAFSIYLEGERRKEEQVTELRDPLERTSLHNANLPRLEAELRRANDLEELDAFGLYVYGVVLKNVRGSKRASPRKKMTTRSEKNRIDTAATAGEFLGDTSHAILIRSILMYPFNWSAWLDLAELCVEDPSIDQEVEQLLSPISGHWMYHFFCVNVFIENKANENAIAIIEKLANGHGPSEEDEDINPTGFFVQSAYLQSQLAMAYYDVRDYDSAHEHFLALSEREPYRLDHMDAFSNVLYVKDQKVALSHLAHRSVTVDKYRPETCIIVGNYYSSKARHEKAVQYFQRALKLDRTYLSAWTLLGHEYIEMKNTAAAIEAYRRAVDISGREYRAWYGLGQTYEILNMLLHALFYFRKAAALHPHDARMWCAIGGCLLGLDRRNDAEKSYERAVSLGDGEGIATRKLAELYREDGDEEKAAKCYLRHLELRYHSQLPGLISGTNADLSPAAFETVVRNVRVDEPEAEALLYLAHYYRDNIEYDAAILCATRLEDYPGPEKDQGKGLLRDIRSRMDQKAGERRFGGVASPSTPDAGSLMTRRGRGGFDLSRESPSVANAESSFEFSP